MKLRPDQTSRLVDSLARFAGTAAACNRPGQGFDKQNDDAQAIIENARKIAGRGAFGVPSKDINDADTTADFRIWTLCFALAVTHYLEAPT
jgi:hypothetical protein